MSGFFERLFGKQNSSAQSAKERLMFVLVHDRADISPATMEQIKDEIIAVISKYVTIDRDNVDINLTQTARENRLVANIPLLDGTRRPAKR